MVSGAALLNYNDLSTDNAGVRTEMGITAKHGAWYGRGGHSYPTNTKTKVWQKLQEKMMTGKKKQRRKGTKGEGTSRTK